MAHGASDGTSLVFFPPVILSSCQSISLFPAGLVFVRLLKHQRALPSGLTRPVLDPLSHPTIILHAIN